MEATRRGIFLLPLGASLPAAGAKKDAKHARFPGGKSGIQGQKKKERSDFYPLTNSPLKCWLDKKYLPSGFLLLCFFYSPKPLPPLSSSSAHQFNLPSYGESFFCYSRSPPTRISFSSSQDNRETTLFGRPRGSPFSSSLEFPSGAAAG